MGFVKHMRERRQAKNARRRQRIAIHIKRQTMVDAQKKEMARRHTESGAPEKLTQVKRQSAGQNSYARAMAAARSMNRGGRFTGKTVSKKIPKYFNTRY